LAHLAGIERSPNTVKAYAHGLRLWFEFLELRSLEWERVGVEDVSRFVAWLRAPADNVIVLDDTAAVRSEATVNRHLAAVFGFYDFHARSGVGVAADLVAWRRVSRGSYKPFLHHVTQGRPIATRPVKLRVPRRLPATLSVEEITRILAACDRLRDRFLFALLAETGMRIGQALGLRHGDFVSRERRVVIVPRRDNVNGARAKCVSSATVPVSAPLVRLYSDYMHDEYGELDSDYVFVNLWSAPIGRPLRYEAVAKLVGRLRARAGIEFTPHMLRHSRASALIRGGVPIEFVSKLLTHRSVTTTSDAYVHLDVEDLRAELVRAGAWSAEGC
jgi:integrase